MTKTSRPTLQPTTQLDPYSFLPRPSPRRHLAAPPATCPGGGLRGKRTIQSTLHWWGYLHEYIPSHLLYIHFCMETFHYLKKKQKNKNRFSISFLYNLGKKSILSSCIFFSKVDFWTYIVPT